MPFHFNSWLVFFYFYCIMGWIFESVNVSVRQKKWVNRGFMRGPWLPIYGSGAVVILFSTLPVRGNPIAVYFVGALAATLLEYITGVAMLALFKVRYWDYRYRKIQFQGHICLVSTIVWGFLSLFMVYVVHPPVEKLVENWNDELVSVCTFIITLCITYDFTIAFRDAMDLRRLIIRAEELKEKLAKAMEEQRKKVNESVGEVREQIGQRLSESKDQMEQKISGSRDQFEQKMSKEKEQIAERVQNAKVQLENRIAEGRESYDEMQLRRREQRMETVAELENALELLRERVETHSVHILRHNPNATFPGLEEETKKLRKKLHFHSKRED